MASACSLSVVARVGDCRRLGASQSGSPVSFVAHASQPLGLRISRISARPQLAGQRVSTSRTLQVPRAASKDTVIPDPDVRIPVVLLGTAGALLAADNKLAAANVGLLGALLLFQTTRVRFVFGPDALEVRIGKQLDESGENVFVGGENKWKYDTFVNWEFWWPQFPVLVYFKETQTKPEGQIHFFPIILNGKQLYDVMKERCGPSKNSA